MVKIKIFKGDRRPSIKPTLKYKDGTIVNLTDCTVKMQLIEIETNVIILNETANVLSPASDGKVQYDWKVDETDVDKTHYKIRFEVQFADNTKQTFPRNDDFYVDFKEKEAL